MAAMEKAIKTEFIKYTKRHYPDEAEKIVQKAEELFPVLYAKAPDVGGKENRMSYNLELLILSASFYEASDHRIDGEAITEMAKELFGRWSAGDILWRPYP